MRVIYCSECLDKRRLNLFVDIKPLAKCADCGRLCFGYCVPEPDESLAPGGRPAAAGGKDEGSA